MHWEYVYIVRDAGGAFKVGHTWKLRRRVVELVRLHNVVELVFSRRLRFPHASRVERLTRRVMSHWILTSRGREWMSKNPEGVMRQILQDRSYRRPVPRRPTHALTCDLDEDCTCGVLGHGGAE